MFLFICQVSILTIEEKSLIYFKRLLKRKLLLVIHVKAPVPLLQGCPTINRDDGEFKLSN